MMPNSYNEENSNTSVLLTPCLFNENPLLISALCRLWSVYLPHAIFSAKLDRSYTKMKNSTGDSIIEENKSWRALSLLSFGTAAVGRLWVAADNPSRIDGKVESIRKNDKFGRKN